MFLLRLKTEFAENLKLVLVLWIVLGGFAWSFFDWWLAPLTAERDQGVLGGFAVLATGSIGFFLISTMFKRDDLKHPQDFWATRPIRAWTFFGTKLVFAFLVAVLPMGVLMTLLGLAAGIGEQAVWHGLETMAWAGFATSLLAVSCMAFPGGGRSLLCMLAFFGGVILTCIILSNVERFSWRSHVVSEAQIEWNLLVMLCVLTAGFIWLGLRQIRDKHRRQRPLGFAAAGILTVMTISFVPLSGGIAGASKTIKAATRPTVTRAKVNPHNMSFGHKDGVAFVSLHIELLPDKPISADAVEFASADMRVAGTEGIPQLVEMSHMNPIMTADLDAVAESKPTLTYYVFERQPGSRSRWSSGSDTEKSETVAALPHRKINISGTVELRQFQYRTIHRGPLSRPFELRHDGIRVAFVDSPSRSTHAVIWKAYMPPLVTSLSRYRQDMVRFRLEHPASHGMDWYDRLEGGGGGGGAFFGPYREYELRVSDREIESNYIWSRLRERGYDKSVQEWKEEAELVCEVVAEVRPLILPVDIEVEVPDPEKLRDLLLKGEL